MAKAAMLWDHVAPLRHHNIQVEPVIWRDKLIIRGDFTQQNFSQLWRDLGLQAPENCRFTQNGDKRLSWWSPDEYLLDLPHGHAGNYLRQCQAVLGDCHHALVDVSDYYRVLTIHGAGRMHAINQASPFNTDLLQPGMVVGTIFANASILISCFDEHLEIQVRSSFFAYIYEYLGG